MTGNKKAGVSVCFFNNKGGVGKTTLACNVAAYVAQHHGKTVCLVDADPQCNATQLMLPEDTTRAVYADATTTSPRSSVTTMLDVLEPITAGEATPLLEFETLPPDSNEFGVHLLPGHPKISILEDRFSRDWGDVVGGKLAGTRLSNWNFTLAQRLQEKYDIVFYDVGPSLGALNRCVLIGTDYFVAPMGCDIFSMIGIDNIATWLASWQRDYDQGFKRCEDEETPERMSKYQLRRSTREMSRFLGYTVQQYVTKTIRDERRPTAAYETILDAIPSKISAKLASVTPPNLKLRLGDVPFMFGLVPLAQSKHKPIHSLNRQDGLSGGQFQQQEKYKTFISELAGSLLANLGAIQ